MRRNERGLSGSVQLSLLLPLAIGVFLLALQWAMVSWATTTAHAAAQDAARAAAAHDASASDGRRVAIEAAENGSLSGVTATVDRAAFTTTATVRGQALTVVPLFPTTIEATANVPTERLTNP